MDEDSSVAILLSDFNDQTIQNKWIKFQKLFCSGKIDSSAKFNKLQAELILIIDELI